MRLYRVKIQFEEYAATPIDSYVYPLVALIKLLWYSSHPNILVKVI